MWGVEEQHLHNYFYDIVKILYKFELSASVVLKLISRIMKLSLSINEHVYCR